MALPIGAILALVGKAAKGGGKAIGGTAQAIAPIAASLGKAATSQRKMIHADVDKLKKGQVGFSEAKKRQMLADSMRAQRAATKGTEVDVRRQMAASGGRSGAFQQSLQDLTGTQAGASALAAQQINQASEQQAERRRTEILQRLKEQAARNKANWTQAAGGVQQAMGSSSGSKPLDASALEGLYGK